MSAFDAVTLTQNGHGERHRTEVLEALQDAGHTIDPKTGLLELSDCRSD